ncbi:hypothetical protein CK203_056546 [Vitis vinifera]|uniref:Aspartic peptidase DDI1-type domain-containing protein n=1 Tax=Vitis vinifera TaxID=29760 RepID=A0A438GKJ0_VITVI|nr:hypothetical protein CK203_056546 [Vitis vinifera]
MEDTKESNSNNNMPRPPIHDQRTMKEFLNPPRLSTPSCFMLPPNQDHVTIRPQVEPPRDRIVNRARASGVYALLEGLDVQEKIATIIRRLDDLEAKKVQKFQIANEGTMQPCLILKKRIKLSKRAFLTKQVIIGNKAPMKYKDPGCPTVSVQIGDTYVEKALLDLGVNVNLLPYSIYKQLGLGELKATTMTLSLAN